MFPDYTETGPGLTRCQNWNSMGCIARQCELGFNCFNTNAQYKVNACQKGLSCSHFWMVVIA